MLSGSHRVAGPRDGGFRLLLVAICAAALALRVAYVLAFSSHLHFGFDTVWYELVAGTVASGKGFVDPAKFYGHGIATPTAFHPPLYPVFLAAVHKSIGGSRTTYQLAGCCLGTATVAAVGRLGARVGGPRVGLVAAALAAVSPALIGIDASLMSETVYIPLVATTLLLAARAAERGTPWRWAGAGALAGLATLARGDGALIVAIVVLPLAFGSAGRGRPRLVAAGSALLAALVVVAPWFVRNEAQLHTPRLTTLDAGTAIAGANCKGAYSAPLIGSWDATCAGISPDDPRTEAQIASDLQHRGLSYATHHAGRVPLVLVARVARQWGVWNPGPEARLEAVESRNAGWQVLTWGFDLALGALTVLVLIRYRRRRDPAFVALALLVIAVTIDALIVYGGQRFQSTAQPALLVFAALAIVTRAGDFPPGSRSRFDSAGTN